MLETVIIDQNHTAIVDPGRWNELIRIADHFGAAILDAMPSAALLLDRSGRIVHANRAAESLLGAGDGLSFARSGRLQLSAVMPTELGALTRALDIAAGAVDRLSSSGGSARADTHDNVAIGPVAVRVGDSMGAQQRRGARQTILTTVTPTAAQLKPKKAVAESALA
jgi:PAS domain-containing protein